MTHQAILLKGLALLLLAGLAGGCAPEPPAQSDEDAQAEIWAIEQAIYAGRADGDLSKYLASASPHYMGWPPGAKVPADLSRLREMADSVAGQNQEELELEFAEFTRSGDTAIVFYHTHRTRLPTGEPVNQRFAIIHVYAREQGSWRLVGALGRLKPEAEYR
jgi:ketosteroid isomerase-like protein